MASEVCSAIQLLNGYCLQDLSESHPEHVQVSCWPRNEGEFLTKIFVSYTLNPIADIHFLDSVRLLIPAWSRFPHLSLENGLGEKVGKCGARLMGPLSVKDHRPALADV